MSTKKVERTYKPQKTNYVNLFKTACADYKKFLLIYADNVGSSQMAQTRLDIRPLGATLLMGKNTLMKTAIKQAMVKNPKLKVLLPLIKGNCGLVFTNGNLAELKKVVTGNRKAAPAKTGSIAMVAVTIPAQNTGCEPTKTQFFQALDIPTKITKGTVEIVSDFKILDVGTKVSASQAELLSLLKIYPFSYGLECFKVYDGELYDPEVLDLTDDDLMNSFYDSTSQLAALSLELDLVNEATVPHSLANAFKDLLSIAVETDYTFKQAETIKEYLKDPSKFAKASTTSGGDAKKEEVKEEEEEEEEEESNAGGLFDEEEEDEDEDEDEDSE